MAISIKVKYMELVRQSDELFAKVSGAPPTSRITYDAEVNTLEFAVMKLGLVGDVLCQVFLGGTGTARMRCHFKPHP